MYNVTHIRVRVYHRLFTQIYERSDNKSVEFPIFLAHSAQKYSNK